MKLFNGDVLKSIVTSNVCSSTPKPENALFGEAQGLEAVEHFVETSLIEVLLNPDKV